MNAPQTYIGRTESDLWTALGNATALAAKWREDSKNDTDLSLAARLALLQCSQTLLQATEVGAKLIKL